jgi:hypothetical protein
MSQWLFETPWYVLAAIGAAGIAVLIAGNNRQNRRMMLGGVGVILGGLLLWLTSWLVQTPGEIAAANTRVWVQAVVDKDGATLDRLMHRTAVFGPYGKAEIVQGAREAAERFGLKGATVTGLAADPADSVVTVYLTVFSSHDVSRTMLETINSNWELKWMDTGDGLLLKEIVLLKVLNTERPGIGNAFRR